MSLGERRRARRPPSAGARLSSTSYARDGAWRVSRGDRLRRPVPRLCVPRASGRRPSGSGSTGCPVAARSQRWSPLVTLAAPTAAPGSDADPRPRPDRRRGRQALEACQRRTTRRSAASVTLAALRGEARSARLPATCLTAGVGRRSRRRHGRHRRLGRERRGVARQVGRRVRSTGRRGRRSAARGSAASTRACAQLAVSLSLLFLLAAIVQAVVRQDLAMLLRACLVALPLALLLTFAAVTLVELGLALTDALTAAALRHTGRRHQGGVLRPRGDPRADCRRRQSAARARAVPGRAAHRGARARRLDRADPARGGDLRRGRASCRSRSPRSSGHAPHTGRAAWLSGSQRSCSPSSRSPSRSPSRARCSAHAAAGNGGLSALLAGCAVLLIAAFSPWVLLRLIPFAEQAAGSLQRGHVGAAMKTAPGRRRHDAARPPGDVQELRRGCSPRPPRQRAPRGVDAEAGRTAQSPRRARKTGDEQRGRALPLDVPVRDARATRRRWARPRRPGRPPRRRVPVRRRGLPSLADRRRPRAAASWPSGAPALRRGSRSPGARSTSGRRSLAEWLAARALGAARHRSAAPRAGTTLEPRQPPRSAGRSTSPGRWTA